MHATCVEPPESDYSGVRCGGEASRGDHAGDAFFFRCACEMVRHHFRTTHRLTIDGCWCQASDVGGGLDKYIL